MCCERGKAATLTQNVTRQAADSKRRRRRISRERRRRRAWLDG